jgi:hypothetical protein
MPIRTICFYTYRSKHDRGWTDPELGVLRFVRAIKQEPLATEPGQDDFGAVLVNGTEPKRELRQANAGDAFDWFAEMAVERIQEELGTLKVALVPIPHSACTQGVAAPRTLVLAEAIVERSGTAMVVDALRWTEPMVPAHRGGPREPSLLYPKLWLPPAWTALDRPYVLIDDVATSGGHVRACAARLKARGAKIPLAICGARAEQYFSGDPYEERVEDHDDFVPE